MTIPESDFSVLEDKEAEKHPAYAAFRAEMKGRCYGYEALNDAWRWFQDGWATRAPSPPSTAEPGAHAVNSLTALRSLGWMVAVHNDYRQSGEAFTFWLFTHPDGRWTKGEGRTDLEAIRAAIAAMPSPASGAGPRCRCTGSDTIRRPCKNIADGPDGLCDECRTEDHMSEPSAPASAPGGTAGEARTILCYELHDGEAEGTFVLCEEPATHYSKCCGSKCAKHTCRHGRPIVPAAPPAATPTTPDCVDGAGKASKTAGSGT